MRLALVAVGSTILGASAVLLSAAAPPPPAPPPRAEVTGGEPRVRVLPPGVPASAVVPGQRRPCPPCSDLPLGVEAWRRHLARSPPPARAWDRASVLSLAFPSREELARALERPDPEYRELAALLLNVATDRILGCRPLPRGQGTAVDVLDTLDRLVATVQTGEPVAQDDLAAVVAAARELNEGRGEPRGCAASAER